MISKSVTPEDSLKHIVREYYYLSTNSKNKSTIPVVDDCCYDIIFFKESAATFIYGQKQTEIHIDKNIFTIHDLKPPYKIRYSNSLTFFTIKIQPWTNHLFFSWITEKGIVELNTKPKNIIDLHDNIFDQDFSDHVFKKTNSFLSESNFKLTPSMQLVKDICAYIESNQGLVSVKTLTLHFNKSRQYLSRIFKKEVLYSLKYYITSVRILSLIKFRIKHSNMSLTAISHHFKYFDQAHFINDFKKICGTTPSYYFNHLPEFSLRHK